MYFYNYFNYIYNLIQYKYINILSRYYNSSINIGYALITYIYIYIETYIRS